MKLNKYIVVLATAAMASSSCTDLSENVYDIIIAENFYQTKDNVIQGFVRPFDHAYWSCAAASFQLGENSADHFMTPNRQGHWLDGENYFRLHRHKWTIDDWVPRDAWNNNFQGIVYANSAITDLSKLDPAKFDMTQAELDNFNAQLRTLRAWFYICLLDMYRNIPIATDYPSDDPSPSQVSPKEAFDFIERELLEVIPLLNTKVGSGGNLGAQGSWTKAGAASLLMRLYLNAELWIGENRIADCKKYAEHIIDGEYGSYGIASRWDAPYDWNNETCEELIYAFTSSYGYAHHVYDSGMFWWNMPYKAPAYFGFKDWGDANPRFALQPGLDLEGNEYAFENGKPVRKFMKYPDDVRLKKYRNLGNSSREGMFLRESLDYIDEIGVKQFARSGDDRYRLYLRDQVGWFEDTDTLSISPKPSSGAPVMISDMNHADQNSGWYMIKYPIYGSADAGKVEADYAVIRLAEVYYTLAECNFRQGQKGKAAQLLNTVRTRYYPTNSPSLYKEDGSQITEQELLDEWGREFLGEGIRRTVLCRFGAYTSEWWDKEKETSKHTLLAPISRKTLQANPNLKQNPGYATPE
ncbi:hypothetical protein AwDysgo_11040 [Bacteroidales bacterium]|nr:hypothetical protein AwDysgo_11040 [Bacteroidales bacterium]